MRLMELGGMELSQEDMGLFRIEFANMEKNLISICICIKKSIAKSTDRKYNISKIVHKIIKF
jgi:hypothetical protein